MATTTMDLSELDEIRNESKDRLLKIGELEKIISEKDKEIIKVQSSKQVLVVTKKQQLNVYNSAFDNSALNRIAMAGAKHWRGELSLPRFTEILSLDLASIPTVDTEVKEWYNVDEIRTDIRKEVEKSVQKELTELRNTVADQNVKIGTQEQAHRQEITQLRTNTYIEITEKTQAHDTQIREIEKDHKKELETATERYDSLKQEFEDFREERDRKTLEQEVVELRKQISHENERTRLDKLFGMNKFVPKKNNV